MDKSERSQIETNESEAVRFDPRLADQNYEPFPSFAAWAREPLDLTRWSRYQSALEAHRGSDAGDLARAIKIAMRAAAVETGAIEGLYDADRGFTFTVATEAAMWEAALGAKGDEVRSLVEAQLKGYEYILDLATERVPIAEAWIRELHRVICEGQKYHKVYTEAGFQNQRLVPGQYKSMPNHVRKADGHVHAYAPVDITPAEMHRLCEEIRTEPFLSAHPVTQASYVHYALVVVHPFADGNGRVARALASVYTYRGAHIPLLIFADKIRDYRSALEEADRGHYTRFVQFVLERCLDALQLVNESMYLTAIAEAPEVVADLRELYVTRGGYTHAQVDEAGYELVSQFATEWEKNQQRQQLPDTVSLRISILGENYSPPNEAYRRPLQQGGKRICIAATSKPPARAKVEKNLFLDVPKDCAAHDDLMITDRSTLTFSARTEEVVPDLSTAMLLRLRLFVERVATSILAELHAKAGTSLRERGY